MYACLSPVPPLPEPHPHCLVLSCASIVLVTAHSWLACRTVMVVIEKCVM